MDTPPVVVFPPLNLDATPQTAVANVATSQPATPEGKPAADTATATDPNCARKGCGKPKLAGQRYCGATCRKADWRDEQKAKKDGPDTPANQRASIKNFLGQKIDAARNRIAQAIATSPATERGNLGVNPDGSLGLNPSTGRAASAAAFRKVCKAGIETLDRLMKWFVSEKAKKKGATQEQIDKEILPQCGDVKHRDNLAEALDDLLRSMDYVPQRPEWVIFAIAAVNYGSGFAGAIKAISDLPDPKAKDDKTVTE